MISAAVLIKALRLKHSECVFVEECKNGESQARQFLRMDAWVMEKSWRHPRTIVYETKVSRSDFLNDNKWRSYLPYGNEFYFVAPKGLIKPDELPPEAGLMELLGTSRFKTVKKSPYRKLEVPEDLYRYILMCRTNIFGEKKTFDITAESTASLKREMFRKFLEQKAEDRKLGYEVSRAIREHVAKVEVENIRLMKRQNEYDSLIKFLEESGLAKNGEYFSQYSVRRQVEQLASVIPIHVEHELREARSSLDAILKQVDENKKLAETGLKRLPEIS